MHRRASLFVVWFSLLTVAHAQISEAERADIEHQLKESVAVIVGLYSGKHLRYESSGRLLSRAKVGYWTLDGLIKVDAVQLDKHALRIRGSRVEVSFPEHDQHRVLQTRGRRVEIEAELPLNADRAALTALIGHILTFRLTDSVPPYWHAFMEGLLQGGPFGQVPPGAAAIARVGLNVTPPKPISTPDPVYVEEARLARFEGTSVLWCVVNEQGVPEDIQIVRPVGFGLDDRAVETVSRWKFSPATRNGQPVAVQINVEVNFRLY